MRLLSHSVLILLCFYLASCAKTEDQQVRSAIQEAKFYLNSSKCTKAKDALDEVDFQNDNADYISTYASAVACSSGYRELDDLFSGNLEGIDPNALIKSLAAFDTSTETAADAATYTNLFDAIEILLDSSGGTQPSTATRNTKFGLKDAGDLNLQALYMIFVAMGKFFAYYGDADTTGTKGAGGANTCIYSYTTADAVDWITDTTPGSCVAATGSEGHEDLESPVTAAVIKRRLCEGIYLYNNMIDILSNVVLPGSTELGSVGDIEAALTALMTAAVAAESGTYNDGDADGLNAISTLKDITSMDLCQDVTIERIEKFYAIFFETIYQ